ncbi:hypothetical protein DO70_6478 [Burkholderia pseudomallei]|nr:hypothetical protein DO70_6478 [Burkholderia pseudomallei]
MSRLSNGVRAAGLMRRATTEALHVARHREAFGRKLIDMPLMQRQLVKMLVPTEQARSLFMQIALLLAKADAGDAQAGGCVRILTPLIKFRACRDARRVAGDAMEVRGGTGYIEEWSDARVLRDAHLGSIWEGTSNIVALDVARAVKREGALAPLRAFLLGALDTARLPGASATRLRRALDRASDAIAHVARTGDDAFVRQAASALYHATTAILLASEGMRLAPDHRRLALAHLVLRYKLSPVDPLATPRADADADAEAEAGVLAALLHDRPVTLDDALRLLDDRSGDAA